MAKRSLQQIEESLRARLAEAGSKDSDGDGIPDDVETPQLFGRDVYDPLGIGGRQQGYLGIDVGIGGAGKGAPSGGPKVWRPGGSKPPGKEPPKVSAEKPRVKVKPGETQDQAMLRTQREKIAKDLNDRAGAKVWSPGEGKPKVWRRGEQPGKETISPPPQTPQEKMIAQAQQRAREGEPTIAVTDPRVSKILDKMFPEKLPPERPRAQPGPRVDIRPDAGQPGPKVTPGTKTGVERVPGPDIKSRGKKDDALSSAERETQRQEIQSKSRKRSAAASVLGHGLALGALSAQDKNVPTTGQDNKDLPAAGSDTEKVISVQLVPPAAPSDSDATTSTGVQTTTQPSTWETETGTQTKTPDAERPSSSSTRTEPVPVEEPATDTKTVDKGTPAPVSEPKDKTAPVPDTGTDKEKGDPYTILPIPGKKDTKGLSDIRPSQGDRTLKETLAKKYQEFKQQTLLEKNLKLDAETIEQLRQDPRVRVMLDLLGRAESSDYNTLVGYPVGPNHPPPKRVITDFSKHPRVPTASTKEHGPSAAAGKFQIVPRTWDGQVKKLTKNGVEIKGFYPPDQEKVAISILNDIGALDAVLKGNYKQAVKRSARIWMSLPGTHMPQGRGPHDEKWIANQLADIKKTYGVDTDTDVTQVAQADKKTAKTELKPQYYAIGDSQAQGVAGYGGDQWNKSMAYRGASVVNPKQFEKHLANIERIPPGSVVAISGGGNDINSAKPEVITSQVNKLIAAAKARGLQVIHLLPTTTDDPRTKQSREQLRQAMMQGQTSAPIVDLGVASKKDPMKLHLDRKGYATIAQNIEDMLPISNAKAGELPKDAAKKEITGHPVGTQVQPDWSKYKYGDRGPLIKNEKGEWTTLDGKSTATDPKLIADLEKLAQRPKEETFLDKVQRSLPPALGGKGELVSKVFGGDKKPTAPAVQPVAVPPKEKVSVAAPPKKDDEGDLIDLIYGTKQAKERQAQIKAEVEKREAERAAKADQKSAPAAAPKKDTGNLSGVPAAIDYSKNPAAAPTAKEPKDEKPAAAPTAKEPKAEKPAAAPAPEKAASTPKIELQRDQAGLVKAKRELSDFEKAFAAARAQQGAGGTFPWTDPKTGKTTTISTLYKGEKPPPKPKTVSTVPVDQSLSKGEELVDIPVAQATDRFQPPKPAPEAPAKSEIQKALQKFDQDQKSKERIDRLIAQANEPSSTPAAKTADELASDELMKDIRASAAGKSSEELSAAANKAKQELDAAIAADRAAAGSTALKPTREPTELPGVELKGSAEPYVPPVDVSIDSQEQARRQAAKDAVNDELKESINTKSRAELHDILRLAGRLK